MMFKLILNSFFAICLISLTGCMTTMQTLKLDEDSMGITQKEGYVLFALTSDWRISSIELEGASNIKINSFGKSKYRNYFLAPVPYGKYEITKINISDQRYFQLDNDELVYDFSIEPNVINYVGELKIERTTDGRTSFELINRSSIALEYLKETFPTILQKRQLKYTGPGKDDFFALVLKERIPGIGEIK